MLIATTTRTPFGRMELIADEQGLVEIVLPGSSPKNIDCRHKEKTEPNEILSQAAQQISEFLTGKRTVFSLPLSPRGTSFQLQVWEIIRSIPCGRTMSYAEIGARLGSRSKARAVGGAAHANPLPLVIPCHRVIGSNGSLTGFAGGLTLKEQLLDIEAEQSVGD